MKICKACGREIELRKKWLKNWDEIKYCSDRCRKTKHENNFELAILSLLKQRGAKNTVCPSEVLEGDEKKDKVLMEAVRSAARRLVAEGKIVVTQKGTRVDPSTAKGPIRLKLNSF